MRPIMADLAAGVTVSITQNISELPCMLDQKIEALTASSGNLLSQVAALTHATEYSMATEWVILSNAVS
jgi:hypothetical protein